ncbi:helix-turn-helix transcriptional regulator (plasmid) [Rhizobium sp. T1470]|uniref:helix-turn-helix transcriptional regulator n=1 Tax=unclassified Rhizobium TaxID=2613769 RepID=UPI001AAF076A|nr:helix-turn-helix transcriptional regulator [Rhizobium sp. T1473]MCA0805406.1 helix-turn-helix transcriptional regulator [Rhizobium sp. T1473]
MTRRSTVTMAPPYAVEQSLTTLGANLRTARIRRNMTLQEVADKIGADRHVVSAAEKGKASTSIAVYAAMLWVFGLVDQLFHVGDPETDQEGKSLESARSPKRARQDSALNDNF